MDKYLKETWVIIPTPSGNNITTESGLPKLFMEMLIQIQQKIPNIKKLQG